MKRYSAAQAIVTFYFVATADASYKYSDRLPTPNQQQDVSSLQRSTFQAGQSPREVNSPAYPSSNPPRGFASVCFIFTFFTFYSLESLVRLKQLRLFCKDVWQLKTFYEVTMTGSLLSWGKYSYFYQVCYTALISLQTVFSAQCRRSYGIRTTA